MAQTPRKRPFVPSEQDKRRAAELQRKGDELGQPAVASILGVGVRTLQRYIKLERSMKAQHVDRFDQHFGKLDSPPEQSGTVQSINAGAHTSEALERVLVRHDRELTYAQVVRLRKMALRVPPLTEDQWEDVVATVLNDRQAAP